MGFVPTYTFQNAEFKACKIFFVNSQMFLTICNALLVVSFLYLIFTCLNYLDNWSKVILISISDNLCIDSTAVIYSTEVNAF